ncbi:1,4-dihydroxy-2-naphthoate polyprenyltransferase [soil metagenome]
MRVVADLAQWIEGARPRTLPAAFAPVAAGSGAAAFIGSFRLGAALLALLVALALQVGVNYANDYSDGIRGTDSDRVGPLRLVGSGVAAPAAVRRAAVAALLVAAAAGAILSALTSWWLLLVGGAALIAAWAYTGTARPYGYRGLGELFVFVFFGLVAVCGTTYLQAGRITGISVLAGVGVGALACAILVANNLRDTSTDRAAGKRTLAVRLGDTRTRWLYVSLHLLALLVLAAVATQTVLVLLALLAAPLQIRSCQAVLARVRGAALIPVLRDTGLAELLWGAGLALGLWLA